MTTFVDRVVLHAEAGGGGHGCSSIHREKFKPFGGPDGGNGGRGGNVVLVVDPNVHTLLDFHYRPHARGTKGRPGQGSNRHGAQGEDIRLSVPDGTVVRSLDGTELADLVGEGTEHVIAHGGRGGLGNAALASARRKAPGFALLGEPGEQVEVVLELRSVADVGLVGYPSAGKSSLIAALSAARPKIADYPFTTLVPHLGVVAAGEDTFTVADVPGLIPGASSGRGLGLQFLRHIERCAVLLHVVDSASLESERDPLSDIDAIEHELAAYGGLEERPRLVALNKVDVPDGRALAEMVRADIEARGWPVYLVSAVTHEGLRELTYALAGAVAQHRSLQPAPAATRVRLQPRGVDEAGFTVTARTDGFDVRGPQPERWVRQTDFDNDEAVGYLADRLARLGVEEALAEAGAQPGDAVTIAGVTFDWQPMLAAGEDEVHGVRGSDERLEASHRTSAADRRLARDARRRASDTSEHE